MTATDDSTAFTTYTGSSTTPTIATQTDSSFTSAPNSHTEDSDSTVFNADKPYAFATSLNPEPKLTGIQSTRSVLHALKRKSTVTILLIGETGGGKTVFLSLLVNLFRGMGAFELKNMHVKGKESGLSTSQSQTNVATLYTINTFDGNKIYILDTPGLADTRGPALDKEHRAEINRSIKESITTVDAVLIIANGSVPRFDAATEYVLNVLTSMFPCSIAENIGFIFTNSVIGALNLDRKCLPEGLRKAKYWTIQNPLGLRNGFEAPTDESAQVSPERQLQILSQNYEDTVEMLNKWLEWLDERNPVPTKEIYELYEKYNYIEGKMNASLSSITRLSEERAKWTNLDDDLEKTKDVGFFSPAFLWLLLADTRTMAKPTPVIDALMSKESSPVWVQQPSDDYNTICIAADCHSNCHAPCRRIYVTRPWLLRFICGAFSSISGTCHSCHHEFHHHRRYKEIHVQEYGKLDEVTKSEWETAQTLEERLQVAQNALQRELDRIDTNVGKVRTEIHDLIEDYNNVSLNKNFADPIHSALEMLKERKRELSKAGTDHDLAVVDETITQLKRKLDIMGATCNKSRGTVSQVVDLLMSPFRRPAELPC